MGLLGEGVMQKALVGLVVAGVLLVGGVIARAAGGGFLGGPGESDTTSVDAHGYFGTTGQSLQVRRSTFVFEPQEGAPYEEAATLVTIYGNQGLSCYKIPDGDFTISDDLTTARLQTTISGPNTCGKMVFAAGAAGPAGPTFTDGVALSDPLQIDVEWANIGAVNDFSSSFENSCLEFQARTDSKGQSVSARARGTIASASRFASAPRLTASFARMSKNQNHTSVNSEFPFACT